jgi:hypothetical protein
MATFSLRIDVAWIRPRVTVIIAGACFAGAELTAASAPAASGGLPGFGANGSPLLDCPQAPETKPAQTTRKK